MLKNTQIQRLMFLLGIAGLFALTADFACLEHVCKEGSTGAFTSMEEIRALRIETLEEGLVRYGVSLSGEQRDGMKQFGHLLGALKLDRPIKHPNGTVEIPKGWLPELPEGHPWREKLSPSDEAYFSYVEERIFKARLFDPSNPDHMAAAAAYMDKVHSDSPEFVGWTYAGRRTECEKPKRDAAGVGVTDTGRG